MKDGEVGAGREGGGTRDEGDQNKLGKKKMADDYDVGYGQGREGRDCDIPTTI